MLCMTLLETVGLRLSFSLRIAICVRSSRVKEYVCGDIIGALKAWLLDLIGGSFPM